MKDRIRLLMESQHMNQQAFARYTNIGVASLSSIFTGRTKPTMNHLVAIMDAFPNVNPTWLIKGEGAMLLAGASAAGSSHGASDASLSNAGSSLGNADISGGVVDHVVGVQQGHSGTPGGMMVSSERASVGGSAGGAVGGVAGGAAGGAAGGVVGGATGGVARGAANGATGDVAGGAGAQERSLFNENSFYNENTGTASSPSMNANSGTGSTNGYPSSQMSYQGTHVRTDNMTASRQYGYPSTGRGQKTVSQVGVVSGAVTTSRKITEIRVFYDDQTWESFVPKK